MLRYNLLVRIGCSVLTAGTVFLIPQVMGIETAALIFTFLMTLGLLSGWCSYSHRQQIYISFEKHFDTIPQVKLKVIEALVVAAIIVILVALLPTISPNIGKNQLAFGAVLLGQYLMAYSYVVFWRKGKIFISYILETLPLMIIVAMMVFDLRFSFEALGWVFLIFSILIFAWAARDSWLSLPPSRTLFYSMGYSQIIAVISFFEVFFFADLKDSGDIVSYRYLLTVVNAAAMIFNVWRQHQIHKDTLTFRPQRSVLVFVSSLILAMVGVAIWHYAPAFLGVVLALAVLVQLYGSIDQFLLIKNSLTGLVLVIYIAILGLIVLFSYFYQIETFSNIVLLKIIVICSVGISISALSRFALRNR